MKRKHPEQALQQTIVNALRSILPREVFMTCFPAGGGGRLQGAILKGMGLVPGVPDLMLVHEGRVFFMELKAGKGTLSPDQIYCQAALMNAGATVAIVRSLDGALECLRTWGVTTRIKDEGWLARRSELRGLPDGKGHVS